MDYAQPAVFGRNGGCDLAMDTCGAVIKNNPLQNWYCPANRVDGEFG